MPDLNILIKPSSGLCNLRCSYCFYCDEMKNRGVESYGFMSLDTLECVIKKALEYSDNACTIAYQGGEPTLRGLDFFKKSVDLQRKYNTRKIKIHNAIQTNGVGLTDEFVLFLKENNFLVGISLDGTEFTHNYFRKTPSGDPTFKDVEYSINKLQENHVDFNILTVVNAMTSKHISEIYRLYKAMDLQYLQFIPCLNPIGEEEIRYPFTLSTKDYSKFLKTLFDAWYLDIKKCHYVHIQQFENYIQMILGYPPEICGMSGVCGYQYVIEANGEVYPCDFYVLDNYRLGNLVEESFENIDIKRKHLGFVEESLSLPQECLKCKYLHMCRGGCKRNRDIITSDLLAKNHFCTAFYDFFDYSYERFIELALNYFK